MKKFAIQVDRNFKDPKRLYGDRSLTYGFHSKKNQHIVIEYLPAGEDICPNIWRFATVEEARNQWSTLQKRYIAKGFVYDR